MHACVHAYIIQAQSGESALFEAGPRRNTSNPNVGAQFVLSVDADLRRLLNRLNFKFLDSALTSKGVFSIKDVKTMSLNAVPGSRGLD
jgi:hypothetical protein